MAALLADFLEPSSNSNALPLWESHRSSRRIRSPWITIFHTIIPPVEGVDLNESRRKERPDIQIERVARSGW